VAQVPVQIGLRRLRAVAPIQPEAPGLRRRRAAGDSECMWAGEKNDVLSSRIVAYFTPSVTIFFFFLKKTSKQIKSKFEK
jgi:hypothetical protein